MPDYEFRNRRTGEVIRMPWSGQTPPTPQDVELYRRQNRRGSWGRAWDTLNEPLTDLPSRAARYLTSLAPDEAAIGARLNEVVPGLGTLTSAGTGFMKGAVEGAGDVLSSFSSPLNLGLGAVTGGAGLAARAGLGGAARGLSAVESAAGGAMAGHGVYSTASAENPAEVAAGLAETAGGLLGARGGIDRITAMNRAWRGVQPITDRSRLLAETNPVLPPSPPEGPRFYAGAAGVADAHQGRYVEDMSNLADPFSENAMNMTWGPEQIGEQVEVPAPVAANLGVGVRNKPVARPIEEPIQPAVFNPVGDPNVLRPGQIAPRRDLPAIGNLENRREVIGDQIVDMVGEAQNWPVDAQGNIAQGNLKRQPRNFLPGEVADPNAPAGNVQPMNNAPAKPEVQMARQLLANKNALKQAANAAGIPIKAFRARLQQFLNEEGGELNVGALVEGLGKIKEKVVEKGKDLKVKFRIKSSDVERTVPEAVPLLHDWMGKRAAADTRAVIEGRKFRKYDTDDVSKLVEMQDNPQNFSDVSEYFKKGRERAIDADLALGLKENYLPQLWNNTPEEISAAFARKYGTKQKPLDPLATERQPQGRVTMKPSFTLKSVIENYKEGIEMGLKPKFKNTSQLVHWYEKSLDKAIADREFFFKLRDSGLIRPGGKAPQGWVDLRSDFFPSFGRKGEARKLWRAHPDVVKAIENYIKQPEGFMQAAGETTQLSKDIALSSGMAPGTAMNAHGFNMLARNAGARGLLRGTVEGIGYMLNTGADNPVARGIEKVAPWKSARAFLDENLEKAPEFVEQGLNLSTEGFQFGEARHTNPFLKVHGKYFEDPLFQNMVPALKIKHAMSVADDLQKTGLGRLEAVKEASRITNEMYGGINIDRMFRDKGFQNVMRTLLIAPDWLESNVRVGKGLATSFGKGPTKGPYRQMALGFMGAYIMANVANIAMSGHPMWENDPGHSLQIDTGKTVKSGKKSKKTYINPFGTALDAIRLPAETATAIAKGDTSQAGRILRNRMSGPAGAIGNMLFNEDWRERPLGGKDAYGREIPMERQLWNQFSNITDPFTPQYVGAAKEYFAEGTNPWEASLGAVEAPVRFASKPRPKGGRRRRSRRR